MLLQIQNDNGDAPLCTDPTNRAVNLVATRGATNHPNPLFAPTTHNRPLDATKKYDNPARRVNIVESSALARLHLAL